MIHYRRMLVSMVAILGVMVLELVHMCLTKDPVSVQGMGAIATIATAHYVTDRQAKVARINAGVREVQ
jgi:hypothetical protein